MAFGIRAILLIGLCTTCSVDTSSQSELTSQMEQGERKGLPPLGLLPKKQQLPLTLDTLCAGLGNIFGKLKQNIRYELSRLCQGSPTP